MERNQIIVHKGISIYQMDFSNLTGANDIKACMERSIAYIRNKPQGSLFCLTNLTNMYFNSEIRNDFQNFIAGNKPYVRASAVVGLSGLQAILYNSLMKVTNRNVRSFNNPMAAKDWLSEQN